jgi:hypothetical protein
MAELVPELTTLPGLVSRRRARRVGRRRLPSFRGCQTACSTAAAASPFPRVAGDRRRARARPARPRRGRVRRRGGCSTSSATAASRTPWRKGGEPPPVRRARLGAGEEPALLAPRRRARAGAAAVAADHDLDRYRRVAFVRYLHESCRGRRDGANGSRCGAPFAPPAAKGRRWTRSASRCATLLEESEATLAELADRDDPSLFPLLASVQATVLKLRALLRSPGAR